MICLNQTHILKNSCTDSSQEAMSYELSLKSLERRQKVDEDEEILIRLKKKGTEGAKFERTLIREKKERDEG